MATSPDWVLICEPRVNQAIWRLALSIDMKPLPNASSRISVTVINGVIASVKVAYPPGVVTIALPMTLLA